MTALRKFWANISAWMDVGAYAAESVIALTLRTVSRFSMTLAAKRSRMMKIACYRNGALERKVAPLQNCSGRRRPSRLFEFDFCVFGKLSRRDPNQIPDRNESATLSLGMCIW